jgi:hypothetical protein
MNSVLRHAERAYYRFDQPGPGTKSVPPVDRHVTSSRRIQPSWQEELRKPVVLAGPVHPANVEPSAEKKSPKLLANPQILC